MELLEWQRKQQQEKTAPLAARMRPKSLDDFVGQDAIIGPGRLLRRAIQADQLSSLLLYGPPGTGKTTLAQIIANTTRAHFIAKNAVLSGVKDIRSAIADAQMRRDSSQSRTILFIDEVHRFNKAQQDALLPWVENGTIILIGATTENPYFEVNKALVSRSRVFQLKSLDSTDLRNVIQRALRDTERGYGNLDIQLKNDALEHLVHVANGDARAVLNALELAVETTEPDASGTRVVTLDVAEESIQRRAVLYDKEGDTHFDTISAFIKSLRGSDPDAALYWLARMVYAGEDPKYIFRRLLIFASEDVGLAAPEAIAITTGCAQAFERVGMPEGQYHLAQATLYLANADKSNSTMGFFDALAAVQSEQEEEVPNHLKDPSRDKKGFGHGAGYLYPHAYREHWVAQQYLPKNLQGKLFYQPSEQGWERQIQLRVTRHREAQLAAMLEQGSEHAEILTSSPEDRSADRWLQRTLGQVGGQLGSIRDKIFEDSSIQRHHVILDLLAKSGLLTWEALRHVPEGGVYTHTSSLTTAEALEQQSQALPVLQRPTVVCSPLIEIFETLDKEHPNLQFDRIIGRNILQSVDSELAFVQHCTQRLRADGELLFVEKDAQESQRVYTLAQAQWLPSGLFERLRDAEEEWYTQLPSALHGDPELFQAQCKDLDLGLQYERIQHTTDVRLTAHMLKRWFDASNPTSYRNSMQMWLSADELHTLETVFCNQLNQQIVPWLSTVTFYTIRNQSRQTKLRHS